MNRMQPGDVACNVMRVRRMRSVYLGYIQEKRDERGKKNKTRAKQKGISVKNWEGKETRSGMYRGRQQ